MARRTRTETTQEMSTRRVEEELADDDGDESFSSSSFPPSSEEGGPFVFATTDTLERAKKKRTKNMLPIDFGSREDSFARPNRASR